MRLLYNLSIRGYLMAVYIAAWFKPKARRWLDGRKNVFEEIRSFAEIQHPKAWFHCSSLGEFEQGRPLIEAFRTKHPEFRILVTFFSPSGYEIQKNYPHADHVCYLPADTLGDAHRFVSMVNPSLVVFVKYEYWLNFMQEITGRKIPFYVLSASFRPDQFFFQWYGKWFLKSLRKVSHFFVQTLESAKLLEQHGISQVTVTGDTRFDRVATIAKESVLLPLVDEFVDKNHNVIVAGSTWPPDEAVLSELFNHHPGKFRLIIAPHEIHETHLKNIEQQFPGLTSRYSAAVKNGCNDKAVLIIDSIGMLSKLYRYGKLAYVGGGFGTGIHNILEAAVYGIPVIFGPNHYKFREALDLIASGGAFAISSYESFEKVITDLFDSEIAWQKSADAAHHYVARQCGATEKVMAELF